MQNHVMLHFVICLAQRFFMEKKWWRIFTRRNFQANHFRQTLWIDFKLLIIGATNIKVIIWKMLFSECDIVLNHQISSIHRDSSHLFPMKNGFIWIDYPNIWCISSSRSTLVFEVISLRSRISVMNNRRRVCDGIDVEIVNSNTIHTHTRIAIK